MRQWAELADDDLVAYVRQRESKRTVKWLYDAGIIDPMEPRTRFEIEACQAAILDMPKFDQLRPGRTTWVRRHACPRKGPSHSPPPIPRWASTKPAKKLGSSTDD